MKRRSEVQWRELFAAHAASGVTAAVFCRERGVCPKYFSLRRRQLGDRQARTSKPAFVPVSMAAPRPGMEIEVCLGAGLQLRVPAAVSPRWLAELLLGLRS